MSLNNQLRKYDSEIGSLKRNLAQIREKGTARINLHQYTKLGLVNKRYRTTKTGQKIFDRLTLTEKGNRMLDIRHK